MESQEFLQRILRVSEQFLQGKVRGKAVVREVNDLIGDHTPDEILEELMEIIDEFQYELAFYVEDEEMRKQYEGYYGPEELKEKVEEYYPKLKPYEDPDWKKESE